MQEENKKKELLRNLVLYGLIGCLASGTDALVFFVLTSLCNIYPLYANLISVPIGILISFLLNRRFNFKVTDHPVKRGVIFFMVGLFGLLISQGILWLGMSTSFEPIVVKLFSIVVVALIQFTLNKLISFGVKM